MKFGLKKHIFPQKKRTSEDVRFVLALPIFPGRLQPSIVGRSELNFCVRDGNRWTLTAINTNFFRKAFAFLYVKALRL